MARCPFSSQNGTVDPKILDRLTSRRVSVALMIFIVGAAVLGNIIPQRSQVPLMEFSEWGAARPTVAGIVSALQLDRIFSSWWFLLGLMLFLLSLSTATMRMLRDSWRKYAATDVVPRTASGDTSAGELAARAVRAGYREVPAGPGIRRFARHRPGWWGVALMHLGMVVALVAAIVSAAFDTHAIVDFSVGETYEPGGELLYEESGVLGGPPDLGAPIRLDAIDAELWPSGEVRFLEATVSILRDGRWETHTISANDPLSTSGHAIYVAPGEFGEAAFVDLSGEALPEKRVRFEFPVVADDGLGYTEFQPEGWPLIQARWDPSRTRGDKLLALRYEDAGTTRQVLLDEGETGALGPHQATFAIEGQWARLIIVKPVAVNVIFAGFGVIALGSLMLYGWVPREFVIAEDDEGVRYGWRAARMPWAYRDELDAILGGEGEDA